MRTQNPYFQFFCGEVVFRHELPFDRSPLSRWRKRLGDEQLAALLQESPAVVHRSGALQTRDLERMVVDTTVQEKAIAQPTDARLNHRAIEKLVDRRTAIIVGRYTHAHSSSAPAANSNSCALGSGASVTSAARSTATPRARIASRRSSISPSG